MSEKVADLEQHFHVRRQKTYAGNRLPYEEVQEWIDLPRRSVEQIDRRERLTTGPAIRGGPVCTRARQFAAELAAERMTLRDTQ